MKFFILSLILSFIIWPDFILAAPIHDAARDGNLVLLKELAEDDPSLLLSHCSMGKTALHWATGMGQLDAMILLLDHFKVDIEIRNANQATPLHVAASQAQVEAMKILLDRNASVDALASDGASPLHFAAFKGKTGHVRCAELLLEHGADPNTEMSNGIRPLNLAISRSNQSLIEVLLKAGARVGKFNGKTRSRYDFSGGTAREQPSAESPAQSPLFRRPGR